MAPLGPAQERQAVSKSGCTFEQLVEAAAAYPSLLRRSLGALGEIDAAADKVRKVIPLAGAQEELPNGSKRPWRGVELAAKREVRAQHELISALEAFTICSETLETGAVQHKLAVDVGPLTELRIAATPTRELVDKARLAAEQIRVHASGHLATEQSTDHLQGVPDVREKPTGRPEPRFEMAYQSYQDAAEKMGFEPSDRDAYEWLKEHGSNDYQLPEFHTWKRYVRGGRKFYETQKNSPRAARTGRSIVPADDVQTRRDRD